MITVRENTFETNSSSTHSIVMCLESDYKKFKNGELFLNRYSSETWLTHDEVLATLKAKAEKYGYSYASTYEQALNANDSVQFGEALREADIYTYDEFQNLEYEHYQSTFVTPAGEKVVAFGYYGEDY